MKWLTCHSTGAPPRPVNYSLGTKTIGDMIMQCRHERALPLAFAALEEMGHAFRRHSHLVDNHGMIALLLNAIA
jgi:hypothetical protein